MRIVTKGEFEEFINNYPKPLEKDFFMDKYTWNDFSEGKVWPESIVAICSSNYFNEPIVYRIKDKQLGSEVDE